MDNLGSSETIQHTEAHAPRDWEWSAGALRAEVGKTSPEQQKRSGLGVCITCRGKVAISAKACPHCGQDNPTENASGLLESIVQRAPADKKPMLARMRSIPKMWIWATGVLCVVVIIYVVPSIEVYCYEGDGGLSCRFENKSRFSGSTCVKIVLTKGSTKEQIVSDPVCANVEGYSATVKRGSFFKNQSGRIEYPLIFCVERSGNHSTFSRYGNVFEDCIVSIK